MLSTRTGGFPIGFRLGWSDWQKDLSGLVHWAKENEFACLDVGADVAETGPVLAEAGLRMGSVDLTNWSQIFSQDAAKREEAVEANLPIIAKATEHGCRNFFLVVLPEDPMRSRSENFADAVAGLKLLAPILEQHGGRVVIEGWPGAGALCCNPETYRAAIDHVGSPAIGVNYDPSHLIRMGIDPIRFVEEFSASIYHIHGKDTEIFTDAVYEVGTEQGAVLTKGHGFGSATWRYTIPGHGCMRWTTAFEILAQAGYKGMVSIELEDENFNGSEAGEKAGLLAGGHFLASC